MNGLLLIVIILEMNVENGLGSGMRVKVGRKLGRWLKGYGMRGVGNVYGYVQRVEPRRDSAEVQSRRGVQVL